MTPDELRKLDAEVHTKVMGEPVILDRGTNAPYTSVASSLYDLGGGVVPVPRYSTDIAAAWRVVEKFRPYVKVDARGCHGVGPWVCSLWVGGPEVQGDGNTAPLAICRAALKAVESASLIRHSTG